MQMNMKMAGAFTIYCSMMSYALMEEGYTRENTSPKISLSRKIKTKITKRKIIFDLTLSSAGRLRRKILENQMMHQPRISVVRKVERAWTTRGEFMKIPIKLAPPVPMSSPAMFTIMTDTAVISVLSPFTMQSRMLIAIVIIVRSRESSMPQ